MSNQNQSQIDDTGIRAYKPNEKAPSFVKANITIDIEQLTNFANDNSHLLSKGNDGKYRLKMQVLEKKDGSGFYAKVDEFKPRFLP